MGSLTAWCYWCWRWDSLYIPDGIDHGLCPRCIEIITAPGEEEPRPPWQPDARARKTALLMKANFPYEVAKQMAEFIHEWWEP